MRVNRPSLVLPFVLSAVAALASGCGGGVHYTPPAYDNQNGLTIKVQSIEVDDDELQLKLTFQNTTPKVMMVNRDLITAKFPDGSVRTRDRGMSGMFGGAWSEATHMLPPNGGVHDVFINFPMPKVADTVAIQLGGITLDGQPAVFPDYVVVVQPKK